MVRWENKLINVGCTGYQILSKLNLGNACYHAVQNILSSHVLSKNVMIKICRTVILPVVFKGVKLGFSC
jgi:hypothetical protein